MSYFVMRYLMILIFLWIVQSWLTRRWTRWQRRHMIFLRNDALYKWSTRAKSRHIESMIDQLLVQGAVRAKEHSSKSGVSSSKDWQLHDVHISTLGDQRSHQPSERSNTCRFVGGHAYVIRLLFRTKEQSSFLAKLVEDDFEVFPFDESCNRS